LSTSQPDNARAHSRGLGAVSIMIFLAIVLTLWVTLGYVLPTNIFAKPDQRGQFGDMFGAVNSLFSALAFAGVIYTILLQRQELALQREELEQTRAELARAASAQEAATGNLAQQAAALEATALLNALAALVEHYRLRFERVPGLPAKEKAAAKEAGYAAALEEELERLLAGRQRQLSSQP
jgi:hypothetical protein